MIQLRTLGRLELMAGEASALRVLPAQPKPLALLAYLAIATPRGPQRRDALLALFWPELGDDEARRALRQALHRIRYHVGDALLRTERDGHVGLADDGAWCDAIAFERELDAGHTEGALALYQGAFFDGVFVSDVSPDFEQWVDVVRTRLSARAATAADTLACHARNAGDRSAALAWAMRASRLAPDDEKYLRSLMTALAADGDRAGALRAHHAFTDRLAEEFDAEPEDETTVLATSLRAAVALPPPTIAAPEREPMPAPESTSEPEPSVIASSTAAQRTRLRHRRWWIAGAAAAFVLILTVLGAYRANRAPASIASILLADFRNHTRDSLLAGAVTEALRADLSQSRRTRVMSRTQVQTVLDRMRQPNGDIGSDAIVREVAERHGVTALVTGDVSSLGAGYTVSTELTSVKDGEVLLSLRESAADSSGLLAAVDRVSERLRRAIGESRWSMHSTPPLEAVTTSSLQALRLYSQAIRVGDQEGNSQRAVEILRQAVVLDTTFAMAYRKLGIYYREMGLRAAADDALAHAFRNRAHLPELERLHTAGSYFSNAAIPDSAIDTYRALLAIYPNDMRALNNLGDVYMDLREYGRGESLFHKSIEADSTVALLFNHLATDQFNGGRYDAAERTLRARAHKFPPQQDAEAIEASLEMMRGDYDAAKNRSAQMLVDAGSDAGGRVEPLKMLGVLSMIRGRLHEADQSYAALEELQSSAGSGGGYLEAAIARAYIDVEYRHLPLLARAVLDSAVARYPLQSLEPLDRNYAPLAYLYALAGDPARARELLANVREYERAPGVTRGGLGLRDEGTYLRALGVTELAEGRQREAIVTLRRSVDLYYCPSCTLPDLALAYDRAGAADSAIAVYQRYVTTPWSEWQNAIGDSRATAYQRLGALHEIRGDTAAAITAYEQVAALWAHADVEMEPQVAAARQRASALGASRTIVPPRASR